MGKHKKFLKSEKAKVKLKSIKLPKGLNVTKTEFKTRKIVIKEQLRETVLEEGRIKQNVKELLSRLKHHNSSFRNAAIKSLSEYIDHQRDEIHRNLGILIQGIAGVCLDIEKDIRRESFKLLGTLFSLFPAQTIEPFFEMVSSYLRCAMTHIQQPIQEDSLLMLDVLLIHVPHLVAGNSNRIFTNFLDMISKFRTDAKPGRTLTTNVKNKITTIKWRTKILERLKEMLATMIKHRKTAGKVLNRPGVDARKVECLFVPNAPNHFPLYRSSLNRTYNLSNVLLPSRDLMKDTESDRLRSYIRQLIPLLFESWLEVRCSDKQIAQRGQILITNDAASTLKIVLHILTHLWDLAVLCDAEENDDEVCNWFKKECEKEFNEHVMNGFPYQQAEGTGASKTKSKGQATHKEVSESGGPHCLNQNLNIIYLYCIIHARDKKLNPLQVRHILEFLTDNIETFKKCSPDWVSPLPKGLREILYTNGRNFIKIDKSNTILLLKTVLNCFQNELFDRENRTRILTLLCDIILDNDLYNAYGPEQFEHWLHELPDLLSKPQVAHNVLLTLSKLGKQKSHIFLQALKKSSCAVIENLSKIKIIGCENQFEGQKSLMNMFYWIDDWSSEEKTKILFDVEKFVTEKESVNYFRFVLSESFENSNDCVYD